MGSATRHMLPDGLRLRFPVMLGRGGGGWLCVGGPAWLQLGFVRPGRLNESSEVVSGVRSGVRFNCYSYF